MASIHTRRATASDARALTALAARTFPLACPEGTLTEDIDHFVRTVLSEAAFTAYVDDPDRVVVVAEQPDAAGKERIVGYTMIVLSEPSDPDVASSLTAPDAVEVNKLYVDADAHGSGAGAALMDSAVIEATARGRGALWLGVNEHNARALAFYRRSGFRPVGERRFSLGSVLHRDHVMQRDLRAS